MPSSILPIQKLSIPPTGFHLLVKLYLNGRKALFVVDTGASQTVLDTKRFPHFMPKSLKQKLNAVTAGIGSADVESHYSIIKSFRLGDLTLRNFDLILLDLAIVNNSYKTMGFEPVDGILGSDLLQLYNGVVDFKKSILKISWK
ncbi:hypothetical protein BH11BAC2_BH11BAC2_14450 [soil metagenome]